MESLQIAQILADLSDLQNTDPASATALLAANHALSPASVRRKSLASNLPEPARFDRLGRRIVGPVKTTPAVSRGNSNMSGFSMTSTGTGNGSGCSSGVATPNTGNRSPVETDEDMKRAKTLLELFERRGKFKQMGDTGLAKSKERVDAVVARYAKKDLEEKERVARARYLGPRA